jgi:fructose-1,6-bisphosphatase/inositol monophosphatase family enzyme
MKHKICPNDVSQIIRLVAEIEILPRFRDLKSTQIWEKAPGQIVTEADVAAERRLHLELTSRLPGTLVGEESTAADPRILIALERDPVVWIIDPVDGTKNFSKGKPKFAVIVALVIQGKTEMGWIYDPITDRMIHAVRGEGAWKGDHRLRVLNDGPISTMKGSAHFQSPLVPHVAEVGRGGSTGHDYIDLATGALHFAHFNRLYPWDHAAGILIHHECGGFSQHIDGTPYHPVGVTDKPVIAAPAQKSWEALEKVSV